MVTVTLITKNGIIHSFPVLPGDDALSTLDKFFKKHRLDIVGLQELSVTSSKEDTVHARTARASLAALQFKIKGGA